MSSQEANNPQVEATLCLRKGGSSTTFTVTLPAIPALDDELDFFNSVWVVNKVQEPDMDAGETELLVWAEYGWPADLEE